MRACTAGSTRNATIRWATSGVKQAATGSRILASPTTASSIEYAVLFSFSALPLERVMYSRVSTYNARSVVVIPAHAGIQAVPPDLDPGVRRDDVSSVSPCTWHRVQHA